MGGNWSSQGVVGPYISDLTKPEERTITFGYIFAVACIGMAVMPVVGAYVDTDDSAHELYTIAVIFAVAGIAYTAFFLPESLSPANRSKLSAGSGMSPCETLQFLKDHRLVGLLATIQLVTALPESGLVETALFNVEDHLAFTKIDNSWLFFTTGACGLVVQTVLLQALLKLGDEKHIILIGLSANAIHMIGYAVAWQKWCMYVVEGLAALSMIASPAISSMLSRRLNSTEQGLGLGILASVSGLCSCLGPLLFSNVYSWCRKPPLSFPQLPFYLGAALVCLGLCIAAFWLPLGRDVRAKGDDNIDIDDDRNLNSTNTVSSTSDVHYEKLDGKGGPAHA